MNGSEFETLQNFILRFLPATNTNRRYTHNEFSNVHQTLSKVFSQFSNIKFTEQELLECFGKSGYILYVSNKPKNGYSRPTEESIKSVFLQQIGTDIFLSISSASVTMLSKISTHLSAFKNPEKILEMARLKHQVSDFFQKAAPPLGLIPG
jgi:hypothetical protein